METREYTRTLPETVRDRFIVVDRMHHCALDRHIADAGMHRSQFFMLSHLARCENTPSQKDLAAAFEISPAAVAVTLNKLEKQGYIRRETAVGDSRRNDICVTEAGRALMDSCRKQAQGVDELMFCEFTEEELYQFSRCLEKMYHSMRGLQEGRLSLPEEPSIGPPAPANAFAVRKDDAL